MLRSIEKTTVSSIIEEVALYVRYVDDVFVIWGSKDMSKELQRGFSTQDYGLKLTLEQKEKNKIHFLDVQIIYENNNIKTKVLQETYKHRSNNPEVV